MPEAEQQAQIAAWEIETEQCKKCGNPRSKCSDPTVTWYPTRDVCYATMMLAVAQRMYDAQHDAEPWHDGRFAHWSAERSPETPAHYKDGVTVWVSATDTGDDFLDG